MNYNNLFDFKKRSQSMSLTVGEPGLNQFLKDVCRKTEFVNGLDFICEAENGVVKIKTLNHSMVSHKQFNRIVASHQTEKVAA